MTEYFSPFLSLPIYLPTYFTPFRYLPNPFNKNISKIVIQYMDFIRFHLVYHLGKPDQLRAIAGRRTGSLFQTAD